MKKKISLFLLVSLIAACTHKSKLEQDKDKLTDLQKQEGDLKAKIDALQDTINAEGGKVIKTTKVAVKEITMQSFKHYVEVQASVYAQDNVNVNPEMPGVVNAIYVTEGDKVTKGQVLASVDDAVIQQNIQEVQTSVELAKTLYEKQKGLWDQKIGTEVQYLNAKTNYEALQKRLASLQEQAGMAKFKSPIDGTVDAVNIKVGESVAPGMPTIQVVNPEQLKVKGNVAEAYVADIHQGDSLIIAFPDLKQPNGKAKEITSVASYVSHAIDPINRTFTVEVKLPQSPDYHPNMIALMRIIDYSVKSTVVIPINLIQSDLDGQFVFVAEKSGGNMVAKKHIIKTGKTYGGYIEVTDGLKAGDEIITVGYEDLNNGDAISL